MLRSLLTASTSTAQPGSPNPNNSPSLSRANSNSSAYAESNLSRPASAQASRDVQTMQEVMHADVDELKFSMEVDQRIEILTRIRDTLRVQAKTADSFRAFDGFLTLVHVLSTLPAIASVSISKSDPGSDSGAAVRACMRAAFEVAGEALWENGANRQFFEQSVGYASLGAALDPLVADAHTCADVLGLLLTVACRDFALVDFFIALPPSLSIDDLEAHFDRYAPRLSSARIVLPGFLGVLWSFLRPRMESTNEDAGSLRYLTYRMLDSVTAASHANACAVTRFEPDMPSYFLAAFRRKLHESRADSAVALSSPVDVSEDKPKDKDKDRDMERRALQRLVRRTFELGATTEDARALLESIVRADSESTNPSLDGDMLDAARAVSRARWPAHVLLGRGAAICTREGEIGQGQGRARGLPATGFSVMLWANIDALPPSTPPGRTSKLFRVRTASGPVFELSVDAGGGLGLRSSTHPAHKALNSNANGRAVVGRGRWTHVAVVHYPSRASCPSVRVFIDGVLADSVQWAYPKGAVRAEGVVYELGDASSSPSGGGGGGGGMSWSIASAYLFSHPLPDDIIRFAHHLGPRYTGTFQDGALARFLTYDASTALGMHLLGGPSASSPSSSSISASVSASSTIAGAAAGSGGGGGMSGSVALGDSSAALRQVLKDGVPFGEDSIVWRFVPADLETSPSLSDSGELDRDGGRRHPEDQGTSTSRMRLRAQFESSGSGEVVVMRCEAMDAAVWKLGGAGVLVRLVVLAQTAHELSRAVGVLVDCVRNCWKNSEDMERLNGYDVLAATLRSKADLINMTTFEMLFEFMGLNFRSPDQSTIINAAAYRAIALDFSLWSRARPEIARVHLEHLTFLLRASRFRRFNARVRLVRLGALWKLLFALQAGWYGGSGEEGAGEAADEGNGNQSGGERMNMMPYVVGALAALVQAPVGPEDTVKPVVSYLAATLDPRSEMRSTGSPAVLEDLVSTLRIPAYYARFAEALPLPRVCLLLLGEHPMPVVAMQVLNMVGLGYANSSSFHRRFELASGWTILRSVLPGCWEEGVQAAAFDLLLGVTGGGAEAHSDGQGHRHRGGHGVKGAARQEEKVVACPQIAGVMLAVLHRGLFEMRSVGQGCDAGPSQENTASLIDALTALFGESTSFRQLFRMQSITQILVDCLRIHVEPGAEFSQRVDEATWSKFTGFCALVGAEKAVHGSQRNEIQALLGDDSPQKRYALQNQVHAGMYTTLSLVREGAVSQAFSRLAEWRALVVLTERKRNRKTVLDMREHQKQVVMYTEQIMSSVTDRSLWKDLRTERVWRLDETEGPFRIRKKVEPFHPPSNGNSTAGNSLDGIPPTESAPSVQVERREASAAAEEEGEGNLAEEVHEDKLRKVRHELEPGDIIEAVSTVARISGVDAFPGLLIIGQTHLYVLDGLVEQDDGEVIDAADAPKSLFFVAGSKLEARVPQKAQRWILHKLTAFAERTFLFRDVGLELFFQDHRSLLVVFPTKLKRLDVNNRLTTVMSRLGTTQHIGLGSALDRTALLGLVAGKSRAEMNMRAKELAHAQRQWQNREISNFAYLSILNQLSGRTPSDATQYPVFPWVLKDYTSESLDLSSPESYRDLTKPMGALTEDRRAAAEARYTSLESVGEPPFHYGTHFSSSMTVCHFLIRMAPYTEMFKTLQGGEWDLPDRLFGDLGKAWTSASRDVRGDVRELIPEFFTCPEFLENSSNHDFGVLQSTGERINDVKLPPWAKGDATLFIALHRQALESHHVSEHLHEWIDLIWGHKQRDVASYNVFHPLSYEGSIDIDAITDELEREATVGIIHNFGQTPRKLFTTPHPSRNLQGLLTLPFGVERGVPEDAIRYQCKGECADSIGSLVESLTFDSRNGKVVPLPQGVVCIPGRPDERVEWDEGDNDRAGALRVRVAGKVVQTLEQIYPTCAAFADAETLLVGTSEHLVRSYALSPPLHTSGDPRGSVVTGQDGASGSGSSILGGGPGSPLFAHHHHASARIGLSIRETHMLRAHEAPVTCVTASGAWGVGVSGGREGAAVVWRLGAGGASRVAGIIGGGRGVVGESTGSGGSGSGGGEAYVATIWHSESGSDEGVVGNGNSVTCVAINESNGFIASCSRRYLCLHTINARPIARLSLSPSPSMASPMASYGEITALAFHVREYSRVGILALGGRGCVRLVTWERGGCVSTADEYECVTRPDSWEFVEVATFKESSEGDAPWMKKLRTLPGSKERPARVTALSFRGETLVVGDERGTCVEWA
ncbi:beach-domain-containing protein [Coniophora puteana RWD-64-598 SS2]|uniref:Beach-domain-containing protein n=1 Tax=Coniophora puteana (strain RWD-64-598) TaxID=741705 RepID=A0A5M3M8I2_CONPW|nr:beach-domain-containing protein [Coniophora puteana RWD-64-598 SS2]EIW75538.1 beach-domain-containing protein [Coniophora puteana RWD-64-598 SS2]